MMFVCQMFAPRSGGQITFSLVCLFKYMRDGPFGKYDRSDVLVAAAAQLSLSATSTSTYRYR